MTGHALADKNVLIARQAAEVGANVAIHYNSDSTRTDTEQTLAAVNAVGVKGALFQGDLTVPAIVECLFSDAETAPGED